MNTFPQALDALSILNAVPANYLILSPDAPRFTIVGATDSYLELTDTVRENIIGQSIFEVFPLSPAPSDLLENLRHSLYYVSENKRQHRMSELRYDAINPAKDGVEFKVCSPLNKPVLNEKGEVEYIIHAIEDNSLRAELEPVLKANAADRKNQESDANVRSSFNASDTRSASLTDLEALRNSHLQLQRSNDRLQGVFNSAQSGMFTFAPVTDEHGEIIDFRFVITNPYFAAYVGQTPEVLNGALGSTWFPGYLENGVFDMYRKTFLTGETLRMDIHYNVDRHDIYLDLQSVKVAGEVFVTFTDYTPLKKAQIQLEKYVEDLKRSNANLEEFAYAASHDLKEPIRKIRTFSDRIKLRVEARLSEEELNYFQRMDKATDRMQKLINDLLDYSHVSMPNNSLENINLNAKVSQVLEDLELEIAEKNARIIVGPLPSIKGSRRQLLQLFQNLITNALKFRKPGVAPEIRISASVVRGESINLSDVPQEFKNKLYNLVEVSDNGIGFEQEYVDKIFKMFQRLHGKAEFEGTGIGLAIVRKVVDNHKGFIWAESKPNEGASFKILLPIE